MDQRNIQQSLRWFAYRHKNGEPITLEGEEAATLSNDISEALHLLDQFVEAAMMRKMTDEEKWGDQGAPK